MNSPEGDVEAFWQHVAALEAEHGLDLTDEGKMALVSYIGEHGFNPDVTRQGFASIAAEAGADVNVDYDDGGYEAIGEEMPPAPAGFEKFGTQVTSELTRLQKKLGRQFTTRELDAMGDRMVEQAEREDRVDAEAALKAYDEEIGRKPQDEWNHGDWGKWGAERMEEARREQEAASEDEPRVLDPDNNLKDLIEITQHRYEGGDVEYVEE